MPGFYFTEHVLLRMLGRKILRWEIEHVILHGEVIETYPDDIPHPSRLMLAHTGRRCLHVVSAYDTVNEMEIAVTVYEPDTSEWMDGFKVRKKS